MRIHRIVHTTQAAKHHHITQVSTDTAAALWTVDEVRRAINRGEVFYTAADGHTAFVHLSECVCGYATISSDPDAPGDIDLDHLSNSA